MKELPTNPWPLCPISTVYQRKSLPCALSWRDPIERTGSTPRIPVTSIWIYDDSPVWRSRSLPQELEEIHSVWGNRDRKLSNYLERHIKRPTGAHHKAMQPKGDENQERGGKNLEIESGQKTPFSLGTLQRRWWFGSRQQFTAEEVMKGTNGMEEYRALPERLSYLE